MSNLARRSSLRIENLLQECLQLIILRDGNLLGRFNLTSFYIENSPEYHYRDGHLNYSTCENIVGSEQFSDVDGSACIHQIGQGPRFQPSVDGPRCVLDYFGGGTLEL